MNHYILNVFDKVVKYSLYSRLRVDCGIGLLFEV